LLNYIKLVVLNYPARGGVNKNIMMDNKNLKQEMKKVFWVCVTILLFFSAVYYSDKFWHILSKI